MENSAGVPSIIVFSQLLYSFYSHLANDVANNVQRMEN